MSTEKEDNTNNKMEEFAKKTREAAAWFDGSGYLHAKPKEDKK